MVNQGHVQGLGENRISVSVIMCTYNGAGFIEEQIMTIVNQTYPIKEIIIFDDGSTDDTVAIIRKLALYYPIIQLHINAVNLGHLRNFEQAIQAGTGDVIAIADQDDVWLPQKIERMIKAWKPECPLIYCYSYQTIDIPEKVPEMNSRVRRFEGTDARKIYMYNTVSGHAIIIRRSFLPLVLPFHTGSYYDWWMAVVACYNGGVQFVPEVLVYQRKHGTNVTAFLDHQYTRKQILRIFKTDGAKNCAVFPLAPNMSSSHQKVARKLSLYTERSIDAPFYWPLFWHIIRYRKLFYSYKTKKFAFFSHIKHAYRFTKS